MDIVKILDELYGYSSPNNEEGIIKKMSIYAGHLSGKNSYDRLKALIIDLDDKFVEASKRTDGTENNNFINEFNINELSSDPIIFIFSVILQQAYYSSYKLKNYVKKYNESIKNQAILNLSLDTYKTLTNKIKLDKEEEKEEFPSNKRVLSEVRKTAQLQLLCIAKFWDTQSVWLTSSEDSGSMPACRYSRTSNKFPASQACGSVCV